MLHIACGNGNAKNVESLLMASANINAVCGDSCDTPLMVACSKGYTMVVSVLLRYRCNVLIKNKNGMNAFSVAATGETKNHDTILKQIYSHLINNKKKYNENVIKQYINEQENKFQQTAYLLACKTGYATIISTLVYHCGVDVTKQDVNGKFGSDLLTQKYILGVDKAKLKKLEQAKNKLAN